LLEASLKARHQRDAKAILTVRERTKFRAMIRPGDTLLYRAELMSVSPEGGKAAVQASCDGRVVATTAMVFAFKYIDDPLLESRRASLLKTWMEPSSVEGL
jgi:3-hydroxymyristoyl/3-hydroxydecanoyl-(acyl carrier protein) dehydratase